MKVKYNLGIGFPSANHKDEYDIPDSELEGLTDKEIDELINEYLMDWAWNHIEVWYEKID